MAWPGLVCTSDVRASFCRTASVGGSARTAFEWQLLLLLQTYKVAPGCVSAAAAAQDNEPQVSV
jgi:hypothetical protein